ncbi:MAG: two-component sensor histidine kinase [Planctomycetes bacterium]|nr:two-component sensor histidine kinase [Planctomycetota bacterium]
MPMVVWFALGLAVGIAASIVAARIVVKRSLSRALVAERRARTAERLAEIGGMTGGLAHEIKNPLSTIGLNAQLLKEELEEIQGDEDRRGRMTRRLDALKREVERLRGILQDFLEYAGELRLDLKPLNVSALVDELGDFFAPQADKAGVRMRIDLASDPLNAEVDGPRLKQAVLNLMLNAVQAMGSVHDGGQIRSKELILRTSRQMDADGRAMALIQVIDTGPGISAEAMAKIFQPYFTTKAGGTGLGLPTSRRIVEAHHGRMDLQSEPGRGTDFQIRIPLAL